MANSFQKLKELDLSSDEIERIGEALKKPEFRKLFSDYIQEVQNPDNRKIYEEELTELEKERGNDITFIHPKPGYVIKTSANGNRKAFINISINDNVTRPSSSPAVQKGERGLHWSLPYSLSQPREDFDKNRAPCIVYDVVFHPDTIHLAKNNNAFRDTVNTTALDAVESNFGVTLDKKNIKFPKLAYKGVPHASVIRRPSKCKPEHTPEERAFYDELFAQADSKSHLSEEHKKCSAETVVDNSEYTRPHYVIKQRSYVDMQECVEHKEAKINSAIPNELVVEVQLPLLKTSKHVKLDVAERTLQLCCEAPAKYKLNLTLPYQVDEASGRAEFRKDQKQMVITLPVKRLVQVDISDRNVASEKCVEVLQKSPERCTEAFQELSSIEPSEKCIEKSSEFRTKFLDENIHYDLPEFTCHVLDNIIAFTLNVKNVDEKSVDKLVFNDDNSLHVKFTSISSSFYPSNYAFCVKLPSHKINKEDLTVEVWDNNVILQVPVCSTEKRIDEAESLISYLYGLSTDNLVEKYVEEPEFINRILSEGHLEKGTHISLTAQIADSNPIELRNNDLDDNTKNGTEKSTTNQYSKESSRITITKNNDSDDNTRSGVQRSTKIDDSDDNSRIGTQRRTKKFRNARKEPTKAINIVGAPSYESSGDDLSPCKVSKSILKRWSSDSVWGPERRCVSESGLDYYVSSSLENCLSGEDIIPEGGGGSCSLKKTVRFNDVVMRQLFRSNSSILGQKKKNQRKAKNKKRCVERRHSESETSGDEKKEGGDKKTSNYGKEVSEETEDESHDIFHLEVDN